MLFLSERCLFQTLLLSALEHYTEKIFVRLAPLYALDDGECETFTQLLNDDTFKKLKSSEAVVLHENFLQSFCTDKNEFGRKEIEWDALEIKRQAYTTFESFASQPGGVFEALSAADTYSQQPASLALLYYINDADTELYLMRLRHAAGHGNAEAAILLMAFEPERRAALFEKLSGNKELLLRNDDTLSQLAIRYELNTKGVQNDDQ